MSNKFCTNCGAEMEGEAKFCPSCGMKVIDKLPDPVEEAPVGNAPMEDGSDRDATAQEAPKRTPLKVNRFVSLGVAALAFVLSIVMLILAFCPILKLVQYGDAEIQIKISPAHNILFLFDSVQSKDQEDLADTQLYERYEDTYEDFVDEIDGDEDDYDELSGKAKRLYNKCAIYETRMSLRTNAIGLTPAILIAAILSLVYMLAAIALLALSAWYLLSVLFGTAGIGEKIGGLGKILSLLKLPEERVKSYLIAAVCAFPMLAISLFSAMFMTFEAENAKALIAPTGVCIIVFCALLFAGFLAEKVLAKELKIDRALVTRGIAFVCALLLTVLAFAPVIRANVKAGFNGRDTKKTAHVGMSASALSSWFVTKDMRDDLKDSMEELEEAYPDDDEAKEILMGRACPPFGYYKFSDVEDGEVNVSILQLLVITHVAGGYLGMSWVFGLVTLLNILVAVAGCALMWCNLTALAGGKEIAKIEKYAKRVALIAAVLSLLIVILFAIMTTSTIDKYLDNDYKITVGVGAGIIFTVIFAILNLLLPTVADKVSAWLPKKEEAVAEAEPEEVQQD